MRTFQDSAHRTWTVSVTVDAIKRVRDLLKEDLLDIEQMLPRLFMDPILLCDIIYCICKPQADAMNVTDTDFGQAMAGDTVARAKEVLLEELVDFFPEPSQRETIRLAIEKYQQLNQRVINLVKARLNRTELPPELEAALNSVGASFINSQELSG